MDENSTNRSRSGSRRSSSCAARAAWAAARRRTSPRPCARRVRCRSAPAAWTTPRIGGHASAVPAVEEGAERARVARRRPPRCARRHRRLRARARRRCAGRRHCRRRRRRHCSRGGSARAAQQDQPARAGGHHRAREVQADAAEPAGDQLSGVGAPSERRRQRRCLRAPGAARSVGRRARRTWSSPSPPSRSAMQRRRACRPAAAPDRDRPGRPTVRGALRR